MRWISGVLMRTWQGELLVCAWCACVQRRTGACKCGPRYTGRYCETRLDDEHHVTTSSSSSGGKVKVLSACMRQTRDEKRFAVAEVAADWHYLLIMAIYWSIKLLSVVRASKQLDLMGAATRRITALIKHTWPVSCHSFSIPSSIESWVDLSTHSVC